MDLNYTFVEVLGDLNAGEIGVPAANTIVVDKIDNDTNDNTLLFDQGIPYGIFIRSVLNPAAYYGFMADYAGDAFDDSSLSAVDVEIGDFSLLAFGEAVTVTISPTLPTEQEANRSLFIHGWQTGDNTYQNSLTVRYLMTTDCNPGGTITPVGPQDGCLNDAETLALSNVTYDLQSINFTPSISGVATVSIYNSVGGYYGFTSDYIFSTGNVIPGTGTLIFGSGDNFFGDIANVITDEVHTVNILTEVVVNPLNIALYTGGNIQVNMPLYSSGPIRDSGNISLYSSGPIRDSGNTTLFTHGLSSGNANIPLFTYNSVPDSGNSPLFIHGLDIASGNSILYSRGSIPASTGVNLYAAGPPPPTGVLNLYMGGTPSGQTQGMPLYIQNSSTSGIIRLYTRGLGSPSYPPNDGYIPDSGAMNLFIGTQPAESFNLYLKNTYQESGINLYTSASLTGNSLPITVETIYFSQPYIWETGTWGNSSGWGGAHNLSIKVVPSGEITWVNKTSNPMYHGYVFDTIPSASNVNYYNDITNRFGTTETLVVEVSGIGTSTVIAYNNNSGGFFAWPGPTHDVLYKNNVTSPFPTPHPTGSLGFTDRQLVNLKISKYNTYGGISLYTNSTHDSGNNTTMLYSHGF